MPDEHEQEPQAIGNAAIIHGWELRSITAPPLYAIDGHAPARLSYTASIMLLLRAGARISYSRRTIRDTEGTPVVTLPTSLMPYQLPGWSRRCRAFFDLAHWSYNFGSRS